MQRRWSVWVIVAAVLVGWLVGPRVVQAATDLVRIEDGDGTIKANVTNGHQLQAVEAAPSSFHEYGIGTSDTSCVLVATIPSNKGFVIRSIALDVVTPSSTGFEGAAIYPNGTCSGNDIYSVGTHAREGHAFSIDPGFAIAPGHKISLQALAPSVVFAHVWGYFVASSDVPSTTGIN